MRLIDANAVEKITWQDPSYTDPLNVLTEVREKVRALPTIDAVPVEWLQAHITTIEQQRLLDEWAERKEE